MSSLEIIKAMADGFEKNLTKYNFVTYVINDREKVYLIEDTLILYVGILRISEYWFGYVCDKYDYDEDKKQYDYGLKIEELTYNSIGFMYNHSQYVKMYEEMFNEKDVLYGYLKFFRCLQFHRLPFSEKYVKEKTLISKIDELLPEIKLKNRNDLWEGLLYYFVVIEVQKKNGGKGICVLYTTRLPYYFIHSHIKRWIKFGFDDGMFDAVGNAVNVLCQWNDEQLNREKIIKEKMSYFYIEKFVKDKDELRKIQWNIYEDIQKNKYENFERFSYSEPENKWKNELRVYEYVKKIYKDYEVIYQHRPFYLRGSTGKQMSYDIFVAGLNLAIEYQGKQHFEPIDFFGGEEGYKKTVARDKLKKEISVAKGVNLVYINYWEPITLNFIKEKIDKSIFPKKIPNSNLSTSDNSSFFLNIKRYFMRWIK